MITMVTTVNHPKVGGAQGNVGAVSELTGRHIEKERYRYLDEKNTVLKLSEFIFVNFVCCIITKNADGLRFSEG